MINTLFESIANNVLIFPYLTFSFFSLSLKIFHAIILIYELYYIIKDTHSQERYTEIY